MYRKGANSDAAVKKTTTTSYTKHDSRRAATDERHRPRRTHRLSASEEKQVLNESTQSVNVREKKETKDESPGWSSALCVSSSMCIKEKAHIAMYFTE